jgi:hypothetical protein
MSKSADDEKQFKDQVLEHLDLLFTRMNDIGEVQQQLKAQMDIRGAAMDSYSAEQHMIAQQVQANGATVARLTMKHFATEPVFDEEDVFDDKESFQNVFAKDKHLDKPEGSKAKRPPPKKEQRTGLRTNDNGDKAEKLPSQAMPKMMFPKFDGTDPKIWRDTVKAILNFISCLWECGSLLHICTSKAKQPSGTNPTNRTIRSTIGNTFVPLLKRNLEQMTLELH